MDEILATIRRIIAEDEQPGPASPAAGEAAPAAEPRRHPSAEDDVLELTEALNADGTTRRLAPIGGVSRPPPAPEPPSASEPPAAAAPAAEEAPPSAVHAEAASSAPAVGAEARLVSEVSSLATAAAFARLAGVPRAHRDPAMVGDRPLDDIVTDLLRPLLQSWLDENLPAIVERLVGAEIARITGSRPG